MSSLSRASSSGSLSGSRSGSNLLQDSEMSENPGGPGNIPGVPSDDEDSDGRPNSRSYKERRREAHTQAEQKRRDAIKKGYDYLQDLVPSCNQANGEQSGSAHKVSKATVLQKSIDYIQLVQQQNKKQEDELALLRKEVVALEIMKGNYEQLVKAHQSQPLNQEKTHVPSEVKFQAFQLLMDKLFHSFNDQVGMDNFQELSGCVFSWLEEKCKPQMLQETMLEVLGEVKDKYQEQQVQSNENSPLDK